MALLIKYFQKMLLWNWNNCSKCALMNCLNQWIKQKMDYFFCNLCLLFFTCYNEFLGSSFWYLIVSFEQWNGPKWFSVRHNFFLFSVYSFCLVVTILPLCVLNFFPDFCLSFSPFLSHVSFVTVSIATVFIGSLWNQI